MISGRWKILLAPDRHLRWPILVSSVLASACEGRAPSVPACPDQLDAGSSTPQGLSEAGCTTTSCSVLGAWRNFFGLEVNGEGGALGGLPRCMEGAIRFDDSGLLSRLTSVGWVGACSYTRCGDQIQASQLSAGFASTPGAENCGPNFDVTVKPDGPNADLAPCAILGDAPCSPSPMAITVFYYPCIP